MYHKPCYQNFVVTNLLKKNFEVYDFSQNASFSLTISINKSFTVQTIEYPWFVREFSLLNNLGIKLLSLIDCNPIIIHWKERTFKIFLSEWIIYIVQTINFQNTFHSFCNTVRRGSNVNLSLSSNNAAFLNLNLICFIPSFN